MSDRAYQCSLWSYRRLPFVVRHHQAKTLHDDVRLLVGGKLKNWVVAPHPSLDPRQEHSAWMGADHNPASMYSERLIPAGIGAGPTLAWDKGEYEPLGYPDLDPNEAALKGIQAGDLTFRMFGIRLRGLFQFRRLHTDRWILQKLPDSEVRLNHTFDNLSVLSGKSLQDITTEALHPQRPAAEILRLPGLE